MSEHLSESSMHHVCSWTDDQIWNRLSFRSPDGLRSSGRCLLSFPAPPLHACLLWFIQTFIKQKTALFFWCAKERGWVCLQLNISGLIFILSGQGALHTTVKIHCTVSESVFILKLHHQLSTSYSVFFLLNPIYKDNIRLNSQSQACWFPLKNKVHFTVSFT